MGSQKVLRLLVLHCTGRTYGNAYLITFKLELRTHTHTHLLLRLPLLEASVGVFFQNLPKFGRHSERDPESMVVGWWQELLHNKRCVARCVIVMQKAQSLPIVSLLPPNCIAQPQHNSHVEMTSNTLSRRYEFRVHQTGSVKKIREPFDFPSYNKKTKAVYQSFLLSHPQILLTHDTIWSCYLEHSFICAWHLWMTFLDKW
jgi:hypothetical protein